MRLSVSVLCLVLFAACGDENGDSDSPQEHDDKEHENEPNDEPTREVACTDQSVMTLMLFDDPATGRIREEGKGDDEFTTFIDASGGGLQASESYVYARFTEDGLKKVEISDEEAFESNDWEIAFRRYVVRLNSGVSGPGEITAGRTAPRTQFADLTEVPDNLEYRTEQYFTEDGCEYVTDTSGIGAPATALSSFWSYMSCVQMTKNVYVLKVADDRHVKFEVLSYYAPEAQKVCDATGTVPMPSGAGSMRIRWAFLD